MCHMCKFCATLSDHSTPDLVLSLQSAFLAVIKGPYRMPGIIESGPATCKVSALSDVTLFFHVIYL